jgi:hypothetical protein
MDAQLGRRKQIACVVAAFHWYFIEVLVPSIPVVREVKLDRPFDTIWDQVNQAYKADVPIAANIVRACL